MNTRATNTSAAARRVSGTVASDGFAGAFGTRRGATSPARLAQIAREKEQERRVTLSTAFHSYAPYRDKRQYVLVGETTEPGEHAAFLLDSRDRLLACKLKTGTYRMKGPALVLDLADGLGLPKQHLSMSGLAENPDLRSAVRDAGIYSGRDLLDQLELPDDELDFLQVMQEGVPERLKDISARCVFATGNGPRAERLRGKGLIAFADGSKFHLLTAEGIYVKYRAEALNR